MRLKGAAVVLSLLLMSTALSGCGFKDIDKRFFVVAMGIDLPDEGKGFKVTLRLAVPSPKTEPGSAMSQIETIQSQTIAEAVRLAKSHVDKELDFGHCKIFVLGEKLIKQGYNDVLEWVTRRRDVQSVSYFAIGRPDAATIVKVQPPTERYPGNALFLAFGTDGTESSYSMTAYAFDFGRRAEEQGLDPVLPLIRKEKAMENYYITRIALLDKSKMVMLLTPQETQLYNQIANHFGKSTVRSKVDNNNMVIAANSVRSHYDIVSGENGTHTLRLKLRVSGIIEEAPPGVYDQDWGKLEAGFSEQTAAEIKTMLEKIQKAGVDPFGFGLRYRATHAGSPKTWEAWQQIYPELQFDIRVKIHIEGTGLVR
ncbi:Ger(x)C family germination protein [Paenibacillus phyllosphaerae]|uniref:Ger(X)C family germination protein n=1 Tax=Paenibacillus phyllosphaerae TaxID=274593 RepID=A0A7W5AT73_9BACL|nr:Ger(x)C family spore germination protein [Paenibacillus phyllosphaerae]MBB3108248.1 Ger(x)C family germination protein [Paenibacillus phyllosphaerae]